MSGKLETTGADRLDAVKWIVALAMLTGAIGSFYYFSDQSTLLRVIGLLAVGGVATVIALRTEKGRAAWTFMGEARTEVRKVVWPTRKETIHTTSIVFAMVALAAVFLWLLDMLLAWGVRALIGGS